MTIAQLILSIVNILLNIKICRHDQSRVQRALLYAFGERMLLAVCNSLLEGKIKNSNKSPSQCGIDIPVEKKTLCLQTNLWFVTRKSLLPGVLLGLFIYRGGALDFSNRDH